MWSVFFFKQKTAYEMRISDWSSDVCSSDLVVEHIGGPTPESADILGRIDDRIGRAVGQARQIEARIEDPDVREARAPAREGNERVGIERQPLVGEQVGERAVRVKARTQPAERIGHGQRIEASSEDGRREKE